MDKKKVYCYYCGGEQLVSLQAFSTVCPLCNQRISTEDLIVSSFYSRPKIATSGSIFIESSGFLRSCLRVHNLSLYGRLQGDVTAANKITIGTGARLEGNITATRLEVNSGAKINGFCRIEPDSIKES
ncbi:MAG: polymer-forming cytoskeletal protein [Sedimentisphaerales bacterium]|nr:polymer-forming cytoskeletal protein [Sedimentisphaerales bacterium]